MFGYYRVSLLIEADGLELDLAEFIDRPLRDLLRHLVLSAGSANLSVEEFLGDNASVSLLLDDMNKFLAHLDQRGIDQDMKDDWGYVDQLIEAIDHYLKE